MVYRPEHGDHRVLPRPEREIAPLARELPYRLDYRDESGIRAPDRGGIGVIGIERTEAQAVEIHRIRGVVVQYEVRVGLVGSLLGILHAASAVDFLYDYV